VLPGESNGGCGSLSETTERHSAYVSNLWVVVLGVLMVIELAFLFEAYMSGLAGLERVFAIFTGLVLLTFGAILYAGRLIFYD
jgi:predicted membrane channel-forming protein YqfA (hemolysin III family)